MFHVELFSSSIATGANTFGQVTYFTVDSVLQPLVNGVQVSATLTYLMALAGVGPNLVHVRAQSPSMLPFPYNAYSPNNRGGGFESPPRIWDLSTAPLPLKMTEELDIFATQNSGGNETEYILVFFSDGQKTAPAATPNPAGIVLNNMMPGRVFTVHSATTTTVVGGAWTQVVPALDQTLPAGQYALLGARAYSASGLFFRMYPQIQPLWRPGGLAVQAYDAMDPPNQRFFQQGSASTGGWGQWLTFYQNTVPKVEFFCLNNDTAQELWFDLIWLGGATTQGT